MLIVRVFLKTFSKIYQNRINPIFFLKISDKNDKYGCLKIEKGWKNYFSTLFFMVFSDY